jgi:hypothetical protein
MTVFALAGTSIWSLLAEFYGLCSMRVFTLFVFLPALMLLAALAVSDFMTGSHRLWQAVMIGTAGGLAAAIAYDIFRVPFVFARPLHLSSVVPSLPLFKVFPRFGAMILSQSVEQDHYSVATQWVGWSYHFSNGATFGIMYIALIGDAARRHWGWAVLMAVGLELGMLLTPYPGVFGIRVTKTFVAVTLAAHLIFGIVLGLWARHVARSRSRI